MPHLRRPAALLSTALSLVLIATSPATAFDGAAERGRMFATKNCVRCHAVDASEASPMREAPRFRDLARTFPIDDLADVLVEGAERRHPAMPDFRLDPADASNLTAYLHALRQ